MGAADEDQKICDMDDSVETLSLCDLPMYGDDDDDGSHWDDFSSDDHISSPDQDLFEFFSGDFSASAWPAAENIVFCGKLIPYRKLPICTDSQKLEDSSTVKKQQIEKRGFLGLKSFKKGKKYRSKSMDDSHGKGPKLQQQVPGSKSLPATRESTAADKCDFTTDPPVLTSPHKFHWHVFFGPATRVPSEMKLRDIKNRQSRLPSPEERRSGKKSWGLLKVLGCGISQAHANTMAKASLTLRLMD